MNGVGTINRKNDRLLKRAAMGQLAMPASNMALAAVQTVVDNFQSEPTPEPQPEPRRSRRAATQRVSQQGQSQRKQSRM